MQIMRPWCWYCEREFEDEKGVLSASDSSEAGVTHVHRSPNAAPESQAFQV